MTTPTEAPAVPTVTVPAPPAPAPVVQVQQLSQADIQKIKDDAVEGARAAFQAEISTLQGSLEAQGKTMTELAAERDARAKAEADAATAATAALEEQRRSELSFKELLAEETAKREESERKFQAELLGRDALLSKEREFSALQQFRSELLASEEAADVLPELRELVRGNSAEELRQSLSDIVTRSHGILTNVAQAQQQQAAALQQQWQAARGAGVTAPPVGPLEINSGQKTFTVEEINQMDMNTYATYRDGLLGAVSNPQRGKGLFG